MKLTSFERTVLINQFEILKRTDKKEHPHLYWYSSSDYDINMEILHSGYEGLYHKVMVDPDHTVSKEISDEVFKILDLYRMGNISYNELSEEEKNEISEDKLRFKGFDGNNEGQHFGICKFLIEQMNLFENLNIKETLNSHMPVLRKYREQLAKYEEVKKESGLMNLEGLIEVFEANYLVG